MVAPGSDLETHVAALLADSNSEIDVARRDRVFCNRNLRMDRIEMIGFDMGYTLARYLVVGDRDDSYLHVARAFNPYWDSCLREGNENTSKVSNFGSYSPLRYFQAPRRPMPHEV